MRALFCEQVSDSRIRCLAIDQSDVRALFYEQAPDSRIQPTG